MSYLNQLKFTIRHQTPELIDWSNAKKHRQNFLFLSTFIKIFIPSLDTWEMSQQLYMDDAMVQFLCSSSAIILVNSQNTQQSNSTWWKTLDTVRMIIIMIHIPLLLLPGNSFETPICQMFFISCCRWDSKWLIICLTDFITSWNY